MSDLKVGDVACFKNGHSWLGDHEHFTIKSVSANGEVYIEENIGCSYIDKLEPYNPPQITEQCMKGFNVGDKVSFINQTLWDGHKIFTIKTIEGNENHSWMTAEEGSGTAALHSIKLEEDPWTDAKEEELYQITEELAALEKQKAFLVKMQRSSGVSKQKAFLTELAAVLVKHKVAVCAKVTESGNYAEVFYQFSGIDYDSDLYNYYNGRSHSTGSEYTCRLDQIV